MHLNNAVEMVYSVVSDQAGSTLIMVCNAFPTLSVSYLEFLL